MLKKASRAQQLDERCGIAVASRDREWLTIGSATSVTKRWGCATEVAIVTSGEEGQKVETLFSEKAMKSRRSAKNCCRVAHRAKPTARLPKSMGSDPERVTQKSKRVRPRCQRGVLMC